MKIRFRVEIGARVRSDHGRRLVVNGSLSHCHGRCLIVTVAVSSSRSLSHRHGRCLIVTVADLSLSSFATSGTLSQLDNTSAPCLRTLVSEIL